jgi:hypothetical protein
MKPPPLLVVPQAIRHADDVAVGVVVVMWPQQWRCLVVRWPDNDSNVVVIVSGGGEGEGVPGHSSSLPRYLLPPHHVVSYAPWRLLMVVVVVVMADGGGGWWWWWWW